MTDLSGNSVDKPQDKFVDKYGNPLKPMGERVKETVAVLLKLRELGIPTNDYGYIQMKQRLDQWIKGGEKWSGMIEFSRFDQKAEVEIPTKPGKELMVKLLAPKVKRKF